MAIFVAVVGWLGFWAFWVRSFWTGQGDSEDGVPGQGQDWAGMDRRGGV